MKAKDDGVKYKSNKYDRFFATRFRMLFDERQERERAAKQEEIDTVKREILKNADQTGGDNQDLRKRLEVKLAELQKKDTVTQKSLAALLDVTHQTISSYFNGVNEPKLDTLVRLADFFNVSVDFLLGRSETRSPDTKIQGITATTGLSEVAISNLEYFKSKKYAADSDISVATVLDKLLTKKGFHDYLVSMMQVYGCCVHAEKLLDGEIDPNFMDYGSDYEYYDEAAALSAAAGNLKYSILDALLREEYFREVINKPRKLVSKLENRASEIEIKEEFTSEIPKDILELWEKLDELEANGLDEQGQETDDLPL